MLKAGGLAKIDAQHRLWELTKMPAGRMAEKDLLRVKASRGKELGEIRPDTLLSIALRPEDIRIIVAGGPGTHSVYVPCFGNTRAVSREIAE